jgi:hypothetical protein
MKNVRHTLSLEDSNSNTNSHKAVKAPALAVEDDTITVLSEVPTAQSGEGGSRGASDHTGERTELIHIRRRAEMGTDGPKKRRVKEHPRMMWEALSTGTEQMGQWASAGWMSDSDHQFQIQLGYSL